MFECQACSHIHPRKKKKKIAQKNCRVFIYHLHTIFNWILNDVEAQLGEVIGAARSRPV